MACESLRLMAAALLLCLPLMAAELPDIRLRDVSAVADPAEPPAVAVAPDGAPAREEQVSLLDQFPDACARDQLDVGSCHAFGSVAVLEAAYWRKYKEKIRFSEADLFIRRQILSGEIYDKFRASGAIALDESGDAGGDIRFVLDHGVATSPQYARFLQRYTRYRTAEKRTMEGIISNYKEEPWYVKLLYNPRKHWSKLQNGPEAKRLTQALLAGRDPALDAERAQNQKLLQGFRLKAEDYRYRDTGVHKVAAKDRKKKGAAQGRFILSELRAGRPVCVSMTLSDLESWGRTDPKKASNHIFLIIGCRRQPGGEYLFQTRNSWGGDNPEVREDELFRIYEIATVLTPEEAK